MFDVGPTEGDLTRVAGNSDAGNGSDTTHVSVSEIVPPGHWYQVAGGFTRWHESRVGYGR